METLRLGGEKRHTKKEAERELEGNGGGCLSCQLGTGLSMAGVADGAGFWAVHLVRDFVVEREGLLDKDSTRTDATMLLEGGSTVDSRGAAARLQSKRLRCSSANQPAKTRPGVCGASSHMGCMSENEECWEQDTDIPAGPRCHSPVSPRSLSLPQYADRSPHSAGMQGGHAVVLQLVAARAGGADEVHDEATHQGDPSTGPAGDEEVAGKVKHLRGLERTNRRLKNDVMLLRLEVELLRQIVELSRLGNIAGNHANNAADEMSGNDFTAYAHECMPTAVCNCMFVHIHS